VYQQVREFLFYERVDGALESVQGRDLEGVEVNGCKQFLRENFLLKKKKYGRKYYQWMQTILRIFLNIKRKRMEGTTTNSPAKAITAITFFSHAHFRIVGSRHA